MVNDAEADMLRSAGPCAGGDNRTEIVTIPPPMDRQTGEPPLDGARDEQAWRAVFVGSDAYVQNAMAITYLLDLWSKYRPTTPLHIYGRNARRWPQVPNVTFHGYVEDIADAYRGRSFVVYNCQVPGGIKTKVLEAFGYGVPVVA